MHATPSREERALNGEAVTEISHRRTECFGSCPVYSVTFRAHGAALFEGEANVTPLGSNEGTISRAEFERLVALAERARFFELDSAYRQSVTCLPTHYTTITKGNHSKEVESYGDAAPARLLTLEKALDTIRRAIAWKAVGTK